MRTVKLGGTGLEVSAVGFGGIPIVPLGLEEAASVVRRGFELGLTLFDTARMYRDSEQKIGSALEEVRDRVVLATKTLARDAEGARKDVGVSLQNLRTDRIDLYQLHNVSNRETLEQVLAEGGAYEALAEARADGRIGHIGVTSHSLDIAVEACRTGRFETVQFPFNFVEPEAATSLFPLARSLGMGIIVMKPLGGGWLESARLCFGFLQRYPDAVPIPGIARRGEVEEIAGLVGSPIRLGREDEEAMDRIRAELGPRFCHRCEYCMPCERGVEIPVALGFRTLAKRFGPEAALGMAQGVMEGAESCTECGACLEKCPYGLDIPALLVENRRLYGELRNWAEHGGSPAPPKP